jgi:3'(2'), 5'-bisphosphate nucleotidase
MNHPYGREEAVAIQAVRAAARLCRTVRAENSPDVIAKHDKSPVTVADFGSQALICHALAEAFPDDAVIAEEDSVELKRPESAPVLEQVKRHVGAVLGASGGAGIANAGEQVCRWIDHGGASHYHERFWTMDPIDGTKGFLRGEQYAIALALIVGGRVAVAALACPNLGPQAAPQREEGHAAPGLIFSAVRGQGARIISGDCRGEGDAVPMRVSVSGQADPARARFCESVEAAHSAQGEAATVAAHLGITAPPLRMDSQAKYAVVARGEADIYLRLPTRSDYREKIWDHAAGVLIVEEAGGVATDLSGRRLEFHHGRELAANRGVIVTNGLLHHLAIEAVRELGFASE